MVAGAQEATPDAASSGVPESCGASAQDEGTPEDRKRTLLRKVAQLTKVVVHLNARNDENEARYAKLRSGFEEEIRTITHDAVLKVAAYRQQLEELKESPEANQEAAEAFDKELQRRRSEVEGKRQAWCEEMSRRRDGFVEVARSRLKAEAAELRELANRMRSGLGSFREVADKSQADHDCQELRKKHEEELQVLRDDQGRRLEDLRASQAREVEHIVGQREQALTHMRRLFESELQTLRMQALQKRRDHIHRLEQGFREERKSHEQQLAHMGFELEELIREAEDAKSQGLSLQYQVDGMRATLEEMSKRVDVAEEEELRVRNEADTLESEATTLQNDVAAMQARQRAAGMSDVPAPPAARGGAAAAGAAAIERGAENDLAEELRRAIGGAKRLEAELEHADGELADQEDELTEVEKRVEILEVELEEERLRTHQLQARVLQHQNAPKT